MSELTSALIRFPLSKGENLSTKKAEPVVHRQNAPESNSITYTFLLTRPNQKRTFNKFRKFELNTIIALKYVTNLLSETTAEETSYK